MSIDQRPAVTARRLTVRTITADALRRHLTAHGGASYQQTPEWAEIRRDPWEPELVGWFDPAGTLRGTAVVRYRAIPVLGLKFAFIPQGPVVDWTGLDLGEVLDALALHLRSRRAFAVRILPPLRRRYWSAETVQRGFADRAVRSLDDLETDRIEETVDRVSAVLRDRGWQPVAENASLENSQPRFNYRLPLLGRTEDEVFGAMTKTWRKSIRRAERDGVFVREGALSELPTVHALHVDTARRNGFDPHPASFFAAVGTHFGAGAGGLFHLHLGLHDGELLSADAMVQVGDRAQGLFAANSSAKRHLTTSHAVYWARIRQALSDGAAEFDFGGVSAVLDEERPEAGLLRFKTGLSGEVFETAGAWDLPLRPAVHRAFDLSLGAHDAASAWWRNRSSLRAIARAYAGRRG
jgi:lipid II:glycine glycyltransferase (peptidoglycan interpeptide bridge formation enzyme)